MLKELGLKEKEQPKSEGPWENLKNYFYFQNITRKFDFLEANRILEMIVLIIK